MLKEKACTERKRLVIYHPSIYSTNTTQNQKFHVAASRSQVMEENLVVTLRENCFIHWVVFI